MNVQAACGWKSSLHLPSMSDRKGLNKMKSLLALFILVCSPLVAAQVSKADKRANPAAAALLDGDKLGAAQAVQPGKASDSEGVDFIYPATLRPAYPERKIYYIVSETRFAKPMSEDNTFGGPLVKGTSYARWAYHVSCGRYRMSELFAGVSFDSRHRALKLYESALRYMRYDNDELRTLHEMYVGDPLVKAVCALAQRKQ